MYCLCTRCIIVNSVQVRSEFGKFAYTEICMRKCTLWSDNTCVFTCFHSVKNANTQLIWSSVLYLKVNDFVPCLSDCHCLIQWSISAKYSNEHVHIENCNTIETSPGYKWSDESSFLFQEALSSPKLKQPLDNFIQMGCRSNENEINNAATELANIIISAANKSLKRRNLTKHN